MQKQVEVDVGRAEAFQSLLQTRHSVRGFLPQPVPQAVMEQVVELASRAPSNCNTQPWKVYVVSTQGAM